MLVRELVPGMLVKPVKGAHWILVPWRGHDGTVTGKYLSVSETTPPPAAHHSWLEPIGNDPLLYIGPLGRNSDADVHTPGRQLVLHSGQALSVDPSSWRFLRPADKA